MEDAAGSTGSTSGAGERSSVDRYPSVHRRSHQWRSRRANGIAALALIAGIALAIVLLAVFT